MAKSKLQYLKIVAASKKRKAFENQE